MKGSLNVLIITINMQIIQAWIFLLLLQLSMKSKFNRRDFKGG